MASAFLAALPLLVAGRYHPASYGFLFGKSSGLNSPNATDNNIVDARPSCACARLQTYYVFFP